MGITMWVVLTRSYDEEDVESPRVNTDGYVVSCTRHHGVHVR
jgi:hypothetical protein